VDGWDLHPLLWLSFWRRNNGDAIPRLVSCPSP
jgi:hypothetical protein